MITQYEHSIGDKWPGGSDEAWYSSLSEYCSWSLSKSIVSVGDTWEFAEPCEGTLANEWIEKGYTVYYKQNVNSMLVKWRGNYRYNSKTDCYTMSFGGWYVNKTEKYLPR